MPTQYLLAKSKLSITPFYTRYTWSHTLSPKFPSQQSATFITKFIWYLLAWLNRCFSFKAIKIWYLSPQMGKFIPQRWYRCLLMLQFKGLNMLKQILLFVLLEPSSDGIHVWSRSLKLLPYLCASHTMPGSLPGVSFSWKYAVSSLTTSSQISGVCNKLSYKCQRHLGE